MTDRARTQGERIARLEETNKALAIEIRDLKREQHALGDKLDVLSTALTEHQLALAPLLASNARLVELIAQADQAKGIGALVKVLLGGGVIATIGSALAGVFYFFSRG